MEAIASARTQTHQHIEIIVVNDGSTEPESLLLLNSISHQVDRFISQPNLGLAAARNAGFRAATGNYVVPLDCDDILDHAFVSECLNIMLREQEAGFIYTDYRVFGRTSYIERLPPYNLYHLLDQNTLIYAALIRKSDWESAGGYNEAMRVGYEDWDFWLRMAERRRFGRHLCRVLFGYRKHGRSLLDIAREHHEELLSEIRANHPALYDGEAPAGIKASWAPAVAVVGSAAIPEQTILDWQQIAPAPPQELLDRSRAPAFLMPSSGTLDSHSAELASLAVWGGTSRIRLPDGSTALSRATVQRTSLSKLAAGLRAASETHIPGHLSLYPLERFQRHLANAGLLSLHSWIKHPLRSMLRLIPLALKEHVNHFLGRSFFDLSFYLKFQPKSLITASLTQPLEYLTPPPSGRLRVGLLTPHLGAGGAEAVLMELAGTADRNRYELFIMATHHDDVRWRARWQAQVDHVYNLSTLVPEDRMAMAIYSLAVNWRFDLLFIQNTLFAYGILPALKNALPRCRVIDIIHAAGGEGWDPAAATLDVSQLIDLRVVISKGARDHLRQLGVDENKIRIIPNGVDLQRFQVKRAAPHSVPVKILFAARLDAVKRPLLLVDIALALKKQRPTSSFTFVVAGEGPEERVLRHRLQKARLSDIFILMGHVNDIAPLLAETDILIIPSQNEGIPLVLLEALASGKPVVAANVGAISEALDPASGFLIETGRGEAERFASAIHMLIENRELRQAMGLEGRRKVEAEFSREQSRRMYRELFV